MTEPRGRLLVPLSRLPGIPPLARGLATGDPDVRAFLPDPPDLETIANRAAELGPGAVVMTGQQAGLLTGPLLTLVKAVAARSLAAALGARGLEARAVFWCASEDHDLVEVTRLLAPEADGLREFGPAPGTLAANRAPVGGLPIAADVAGYLEAVAAATGPLADPALLETLRAFHEDATFFGAFSRTLRFLLNDPALAIVDAADPAMKPRLVPLALRLVRERAAVRALLAERESSLTGAGHALQVTADPHALPLFVRAGGERLLLKESAGRFTLKGDPEERSFSEGELVERLESGEWLPSFSALTRPLAASTLHPVVAQVLGPAEIAYWAQMLPLFGWAGLRAPVLVPRPMVALVDPAAHRLLETTGLSVADVLEGTDALLARRGRERGATALALLEGVGREAEARLLAMEPALRAIDPNLGKPLEATRQNVGFALGKLVEKVTAAAGRADETLAKKVARLSALLLPGGALAERVLTPVPALLRWGRNGLLAALEEGIRWDRPGLTVIEP